MQNILSDSTIQYIKTIGIGKNDTEDKVFWDITKDGKYSNKSIWNLITQRKPTEHNITQVWNSILLRILNATATLFPEKESMQHVFLHGEVAQYVWKHFGGPLGIRIYN